VEPLAAPPDVVVTVPGSKSIANRALVCAALADGPTTIDGFGASDDTEAMLDGVRALGAATIVDEGGQRVTVEGTGGRLRPGPVDLDARLAGTASRFLTALAALGHGAYRIDGGLGLRARPMGPLHEALAALGCTVRPEGAPGHLPVVVEADGLVGGTVSVPGDVSSQFLTALMLVAPATARGIDLQVTTPVVSRPYLEITARVMAAFGAAARIEERRITVGSGGYRPCVYRVEPDASSAAYLWAAAAVTGGRVAVAGLGADALQGDAGFVAVLQRMGARIERERAGTAVRGGGHLDGVEVDLSGSSDLVPTLAVVAAFAASPTRITGVGFIRTKETDRIAAVVEELRRCGVGADEDDDGLTVRPAAGAPHGACIRTYGDHRMAMAFALIGLRVPGIEIEDPDVVEKSFPAYWEALEALRTTDH
jgi:3-phosphoshikimate 1-carboxyvinyltransferase